MANIKHKYHIEKPAFPIDGYKFNVQVWISVDGGKNFYYCGMGKFCKTEEEAVAYIEQHKKENPDTEDEKEEKPKSEREKEFEKSKRNFITVRDHFLNEDKGTSRAYRLAWKKPYKFYREHTPTEAVEILKREAEETNIEFLFKEAMAALQCLAEENPPDNASYSLEENRAKILGYIEDNGNNDRWIALVLEIYGETFEYVEYGTDEVDKNELADKVREILNDYNKRQRI